MRLTRIARWEEFIDRVKKTPPIDGEVCLTFGDRYSENGIPYVALIAGCSDGESYVEVTECLAFARLGRDRSSSLAMRARFEERKKTLEAIGFMVTPGRHQKIDQVSES